MVSVKSPSSCRPQNKGVSSSTVRVLHCGSATLSDAARWFSVYSNCLTQLPNHFHSQTPLSLSLSCGSCRGEETSPSLSSASWFLVPVAATNTDGSKGPEETMAARRCVCVCVFHQWQSCSPTHISHCSVQISLHSISRSPRSTPPSPDGRPHHVGLTHAVGLRSTLMKVQLTRTSG